MASGKTFEMINYSRAMFWRTVEPAEKVDRDRSLAGKKRIKARKAKNRARV